MPVGDSPAGALSADQAAGSADPIAPLADRLADSADLPVARQAPAEPAASAPRPAADLALAGRE